MSHLRVKTNYSELGPYGSIIEKTLYCHHNLSTDVISFLDEDGEPIEAVFDEQSDLWGAMELLYCPFDEGKKLLKGVEYYTDFIHNPLTKADLRKGRAVGNSTRIIHVITEMLFEGKKVYVRDHYMYGSDKRANRCLYERLVRYLKFLNRSENLVKEMSNGEIIVSFS